MPRFSSYFIHGHFSGLLQLSRTRKRLSNCNGRGGGTVAVGLGNVPSVVVFITAFVSFILLCLPLASVSGAELTPGWLARKYPNPRSNPEECGWTEVVEWVGDVPRNISWLCDPDHVLGYHEAYNLALLLERYNKEAPCECAVHCSHQGYQIAVALVDRINTDGEFEPMKVKARDFAQEVRVSWFTDHGCDDNVLIFYSLYDDELYISLGTKTEDIISDIELVRLNVFGDRHLTGEVVSTPSPRASNTNNNNDNNNSNNNNNNNDSSTAVPTTSDDDVSKRQSTTTTTSTYTGLEALITEVHIAIMNGPSVSSQLIYAAVVPVLLVVMTVTMCFLANWCCRPLYGYDTDAITQKNDKDDDDDEEEEDDDDDEKGEA